MGEAKRRGTYEQRATLATSPITAFNKHFVFGKARLLDPSQVFFIYILIFTTLALLFSGIALISGVPVKPGIYWALLLALPLTIVRIMQLVKQRRFKI